MTLVDLSWKSCGSQSVLVAYLYGAMSVECNNNNSNAKSKELVLLIFKEVFSIYQAAMSRPCPTKFIWENLSIPWVVWWSILIFLHGSKYEGSITWRASFFGLGNLGVSIFGPSIQATGIDAQGKCKSIDGVSKNTYEDKHHTVIEMLKMTIKIHTEMGNNDKAMDIQKNIRLNLPKSEDTKTDFWLICY